MKKIEDITENPHHYKPLRYDLKGRRRVHIEKSFVLTFRIDEKERTVTFWTFAIMTKSTKKITNIGLRSPSLYNPNFLLSQPVKPVNNLIDQLVRRCNPLHQRL